ncbi:MAG: MBL fold metallo-hydrolase [Deltaproteobacteria bacterium]|nr:MBL fold metallo-hydrolase [Deltaproteobacteria bacterium]
MKRVRLESTRMRLLAIAFLLFVSGAMGCGMPRMLALRTLVWFEGAEAPPLAPKSDEGKAVRWFDDYYTLEWIDSSTIAIGEPRYHQQNYSYLILGDERAVLFDSGPGVRDIRPVVDELTELPVIAAPSHLHFDHVGSQHRFDRVAMIDLPYLRARAPDGVLTPTEEEHLGFAENRSIQPLVVTDWWAAGDEIDLGGRRLHVLATPGHTTDSWALFDETRSQLFTGDYIYPGPLFAFLPNSSVGDYLATADRLLARLPEHARLLTAHRTGPPGAPRLAFRDLVDLRSALEKLRVGELEGEGLFPVVYPINERISLWADRPAGQRWNR